MSGTQRLCYDSTDPNAIPASAEMVAGYIDGINRKVVMAWESAFQGRFKSAVQVRIAVLPWTNDGHVLDVETGDATPGSAPGWVRMRRAAGVDPTVYCNRANWAEIRQAFQTQGVPEPHYWLAAYDNDPTIPDGCVAKQYANEVFTGGNYDLSSVAPVWPGVDNPTPQEEPMTFTPEHKRFFAFQMILTSWGRNPASEQELMDVANVIQDDGQNLYDVAVSVYENPNGAAYRTKQAQAQGAAVDPSSLAQQVAGLLAVVPK
jgi:hypothetical protein